MDLNINQNHSGIGDNIVEKSLEKKVDKKSKIFSDSPRWLNITVGIFTILGVLWAIYTYYKPNNLSSMTINQNHSGVGDNIVNISQKEPPSILEERFIKTESYKSGYKTEFILVIGNASQDFTMGVKTSVSSGVYFIEKKEQSKGTRNGIFYRSYLVSLFTNQNLPSQYFTFSVALKS